MEEIMVSISCATYNHREYIRFALDGFVNQKTNFRFEVLIHDDASTDGTKEIIQEYENKYPDIIKPIYQEENQYSQGINFEREFQWPRMKGKYVALCEGDDYWTDPHKLQKQVDFLEKHPDYSMCCHSGYYVDEQGYKLPGMFRVFTHDKDISTGEAIRKWICPTASIVYRRVLREKSSFPDIAYAPCGDYPLIINMSLLGKIRYFDDPMCAYRNNSNSVSATWNKNKKMKIDVNTRFIRMLDDIDVYTNNKFSDDIKAMKDTKEYYNLLLNGEFRLAKSQRYREIYKNNKASFYIYWLDDYFPWLLRMYRIVKTLKRKNEHKEIIKPLNDDL